jgi:hypothetical protein
MEATVAYLIYYFTIFLSSCLKRHRFLACNVYAIKIYKLYENLLRAVGLYIRIKAVVLKL